MDYKYYIPEKEDWVHGLEYEYSVDGDNWQKHTLDIESDFYMTTRDGDYEDWSPYNYTSKFRVKHIDSQDIEECGWEKISKRTIVGTDITSYQFLKGDYELTFAPEKNILNIAQIIRDIDNKITFNRLFHGTIKNKSELKRIMKQAGI